MTAKEMVAYVDESGTHGGSPYTVMAGWIGYAEDWHKFDGLWRGLLLKNGLEYIHGKDLRQGTGQFKDRTRWPMPRRQALAAEAAKLAQDHSQYSLSILLKNSDYKTHYVIDRSKHRAAIDSKYGVCFRHFLSLLARLVEKYEGGDAQVHLVLEAGAANDGSPATILEGMYEIAPDLAKYVSPNLTLALKKKSPGVQAADLLAYPVYIMERDGTADPYDFEGGAIPNSLSPDRFTNFRVPIMPETLAQIKQGQMQISKFKKALGPHWQHLDRFPVGWSVQKLRSSDGFVLVPRPGGSVRRIDGASPENPLPNHYVHLRCQ